MRFGKFVKEKRLQKKVGLRLFAKKIGEDPGNWCRIEKGILPPPSDIKILNKICKVLEIIEVRRDYVYDLAAKESMLGIPADIQSQIKDSDVIPILFRTIDKKKLTKKQLRELVKQIKSEY